MFGAKLCWSFSFVSIIQEGLCMYIYMYIYIYLGSLIKVFFSMMGSSAIDLMLTHPFPLFIIVLCHIWCQSYQLRDIHIII